MSEQDSTALAVAEPTNYVVNPFVTNAQAMIARHDQIQAFVKEALKEGTDYGTIGDTKRAALHKAGAERLTIGMGAQAMPEVLESEVDHNYETNHQIKKWNSVPVPKLNGKQDEDRIAELKDQRVGRFKKTDKGWDWQEAVTEDVVSFGLYRYVVRVSLVSRQTGEILGYGVGTCSTMESKYIRNPRDAENTVLKMATKRAHVDAVLRTLGISDRFTQDLDEDAEDASSKQNTQQAPPTQSTPPPTQAQGTSATKPEKTPQEKAYWATHRELDLPTHQGDNRVKNLAAWTSILGRAKDPVKSSKDLIPEEWQKITEKLKAIKENGWSLPKAWREGE